MKLDAPIRRGDDDDYDNVASLRRPSLTSKYGLEKSALRLYAQFAETTSDISG